MRDTIDMWSVYQIHFLHYNKDYGSYEAALAEPVCMFDKSEREKSIFRTAWLSSPPFSSSLTTTTRALL